MKTRIAIILGVVLALACVPVLTTSLGGLTADGEITQKREVYQMIGDHVSHVFEVTYRFQPAGATFAETATHPVDPGFYGGVHVGNHVSVHYNSSFLMRHMKGVGSYLDGTSWLSRFADDEETPRETAEVAALVLCLILAGLAYLQRGRFLIWFAVFAMSVFLAGVTPVAFLVFPMLLIAQRRYPGRGFGWAMLLAMPLSAAILYIRIPHPPPVPSNPTREATAIVRSEKVVDQIWVGDEGGQDLRSQFQMLDLEFMPAGSADPVHVLDRVDPLQLHEGSSVRVVYQVSDPRTARIADATRTYERKGLLYFLALTYGIAAIIIFVGWPCLWLADRLARLPMVRYAGDDPRRKNLEEFLKAKGLR